MLPLVTVQFLTLFQVTHYLEKPIGHPDWELFQQFLSAWLQTFARAHVFDMQMFALFCISASRVIATAKAPFLVQFAHTVESFVCVAAGFVKWIQAGAGWAFPNAVAFGLRAMDHNAFLAPAALVVLAWVLLWLLLSFRAAFRHTLDHWFLISSGALITTIINPLQKGVQRIPIVLLIIMASVLPPSSHCAANQS